MKNIFTCFMILSIIIISCKEEKEENTNRGLNIVSSKKLLDGWKVYANDSINIHIPFAWKPKKVEDVLLYVPLEESDANLYYVILKTDTKIVGLNDYIKEGFRQIALRDKNFTYLLTKINYENNTCFYTINFYPKTRNSILSNLKFLKL